VPAKGSAESKGDVPNNGTPVRIPSKTIADGVAMPMLGLGVWKIPDGPETEQAVEWALEAGYRHIDTAAFYRNERSVGTALARSGIAREELFVTTKWMPLGRGPREAIDRSLERLGLAAVDLYLIHFPLPGRIAAAWRAMAQILADGKARAIGVSNFSTKQIVGLPGEHIPAVNQVHFSPAHYPASLLSWCTRQGVALEAYSSLDHGRAFGDSVVASIAARVGRSEAQVLLRWAIQHEVIVIPKSTRRERIAENARIFDFVLSAEDMAALDSIGRGALRHAQ
jgi:diketogulonate reductase-like aldo/keto reductase